MAQKDLINLLREQKALVEEKGGGKTFRVRVTDTWEHRLLIRKVDVKNEIKIQIAEISRPNRPVGAAQLSAEAKSAAQTYEEQQQYLNQVADTLNLNEKKLDILVDFYIANIKSAFSKPPRGYKSQIIDTGGEITIIFTRDTSDSSAYKPKLEQFGSEGPVFSNLREVFSQAKTALMRQIQSQLNIKISNKEAFFNVGHVTAVSELRAGAVLSKIAQQDTSALIGTLSFTGLSSMLNRQQELIKTFEMGVSWVKPQSAVANNLASNYDADVLKAVRKAITEALSEMEDKDWASQEGSTSLTDAILIELAETAIKRGAKVSNLPKKDYSSSSARLSEEIPIELIGQSETIKADLGALAADEVVTAQPSNVSLRTLIPELNRRLPEIIQSHMGQDGALTNRTGKFAGSAEVIDIGDNLLLTYTYALAPYGVFEPGLGRAPWASETRDPRKIIERSIREIAADRMADRFELRRV